MFFEGPEKKLELVVSSKAQSLLAQPESFWEQIVASAEASILSQVENTFCKSYLLSESSLFVYDDHLIMITCGRTQLVRAALALIEALGSEQIHSLIYERKNEYFPFYQKTSFYDDCRRLNEWVPGKAYRFGEADDHHLFLFHLDQAYDPEPSDMTVEVLMHGLSERARELFGSGAGRSRKRIHAETGIGSILPSFQLDDHLFEPYGYSLNAIHEQAYYTIHVTPQMTGSYASFETNRFFENPDELETTIQRVVEIFEPESFDLVSFQGPLGREFNFSHGGYLLKKHVQKNLSCGYPVSFRHFYRKQSEVRVAEELTVLDREKETSDE